MSYLKDNPWVVQYQYIKQSTGALVWGDWKCHPTKEKACVELALLVFDHPVWPYRIKNRITGEIL